MRLLLQSVAAGILFAAAAHGQLEQPRIGYAYPAGGQQGTTFEVVLGGQHLDGACAAYVSGNGVRAEVVEHIRPLNQGAFKEIQNQIGKLRTKKDEAAGESGFRRRTQSFTNAMWTAEDEMRMSELRSRLSTFSIRKTSVPALVETVRLQVTVEMDEQPGRRELRVRGDKGLSNPLVFDIGQLPEFSEESARSKAVTESKKRGGRGRRQQQEIKPVPGAAPVMEDPNADVLVTLPVTINGQILPGDEDRYRFHASRGQQLIAMVSARDLIPYLPDAVPGWFQAVLTLYDAKGREVAYNDDFRFYPDPVLHCEIPEDGEYVLKIRDALHRGREDFVYRIAVGELPFITGIFPMGCSSSGGGSINLCGYNLEKTEMGVGAKPPGTYPVSIRKGRLLSNRVPFAIDTLPEYLEAEPNNELNTAQPIKGPVIVNGRIEKPGDVDMFSFSCRAGAHIVAETKARRLGSPLDSHLTLTDAGGIQLALNDDHEDKSDGLATHHADSRLTFKVPKDGIYHLHLRDTQQRGGQEYSYRLHLAAQRPDFELRVVPSAINACAGTTVPVRVYALRKDGFDGAIALELAKLPPGFILAGGQIPAGQNSVLLTLTVPPQPQLEPCKLSMVGRARIGHRETVRPALPADDVMQAFIYRHLVPADTLQVAVTEAQRVSAPRLLSTKPLRIQQGGTASIPFAMPVRMRFGELQFELLDPPEGITIKDVSLNGSESSIVLHCNSAAPETSGNLVFNAFAANAGAASSKGKEQRKRQRIPISALPAIPFEIVTGSN